MKALLFWTALFGAVFCEETFIGDQVLRIRASNDEQIQQLLSLESLTSLQLDFWKSPRSVESPVDIRVPFRQVQNVKAFLEHHGIEYEIMIDDLQTLLDEEKEEISFTQTLESRSGTFNFGTYHTLDNIYKAIEGLTAAYSGLITTQQIGTSYQGRPLYVLKFSTGGSNRPAIWLDAGIHSREWVTQATALWTVNQLASQYKRDASITALLDNMDVYILIVTNPDGYVYTHQSNSSPQPSNEMKWTVPQNLLHTNRECLSSSGLHWSEMGEQSHRHQQSFPLQNQGPLFNWPDDLLKQIN